eukprot:14665539-Alexandrium_andersonii.AAC.1
MGGFISEPSDDNLAGDGFGMKLKNAIQYGKTCVAVDWVLDQLAQPRRQPAAALMAKLRQKKAVVPSAVMDRLLALDAEDKATEGKADTKG